MRLYQSIYETALRYQMPRPAIESLIRIYSYDVDFQYKIQPGDSFDVLYTGDDETPGSDSKNDVMFACADDRRRNQEILSLPEPR